MIKNLIFDAGDVLFEYRWKDMLTDHGLSSEEAVRIAEEMFTDEIWNKGLDGGECDTEGAIRAYAEKYPKDIDVISWFLRHGELMVVHRPEIWEKVHRLKKAGYPIYLLSNYSEDLFRKHSAGASFLNDLDGGIISYQVKLTKPDARIYHRLLEKYSLRPEECLFFDDRKENVEGAEAVGIHAVQVLSRKMLNDTLDEMLQQRMEEQKKVNIHGFSGTKTQTPVFGADPSGKNG